MDWQHYFCIIASSYWLEKAFISINPFIFHNDIHIWKVL
ncbi:Uncharacterised protein [Leminorella grimontii]|nr:hypothetical protein GLGR_0866 [Leminorella grimontii ATCC 33999 = DSM 5078]VFS57689.1 Uncharacterised protein [Leminorella grimontii]